MKPVFLAASYLAPNLKRAGHSVATLDCAVENLDPQSDEFRSRVQSLAPEVIGIPYWSIYRKCVEQTLDTLHTSFPDTLIVVGGPHASVVGGEILDDPRIDFAIQGEAEFSFPQLLAKLTEGSKEMHDIPGLLWRGADGSPIANPGTWIKDLDSVGLPEYEHIHLEKLWKSGYAHGIRAGVKNAPIYATRGCPYTCQFCSTPLVMGQKVRAHSTEYMIKVIDHLYEEYGVRHFNLFDDNFTFYGEYVRDLCLAILEWGKPGVSFLAPQGVRIERLDREILTLMKKAGWDTIVVAPESGSLKTLQRMKKHMDLDVALEKINLIRSAGLHVIGFFIIGYPGETWDDINQTLAFANKCDFDSVLFNKFQPLPGTPVFKELVDAGEIDEDFLPTNYHGAQNYAPAGICPNRLHRFHNLETYKYHLKSLRRIAFVFKRKRPFQLLRVMLVDHQLMSMLTNFLKGFRGRPEESLSKAG